MYKLARLPYYNRIVVLCTLPGSHVPECQHVGHAEKSTTSRSQADSKDGEDEDELLEEEDAGGENEEEEAADEVIGDTSTAPNDVENEVGDEGRRDTKIADDFYQQEGCPMQEYEIMKITAQEHLDTLSKGCTLPDMIQYEDSDRDGKLNINEFYVAFSKLYSVSVVSLDKALETNHLTARVGDNVEIKCDVTGSPVPPIVWRRNQLDLSTLNEEDVRVFSDGSLYLTRIQLQHAGNYTCHAQRNKDVVQTHILTVHSDEITYLIFSFSAVPEVHVTPRIQSKRPGEDAVMYCHVAGEPFPKVEWLKNDEALRIDGAHKYQIVGNGTALKIRKITFADTGAYMCQATNIGKMFLLKAIANKDSFSGLTRDISSLVVQEQPTPTSPNEERRFFAFHEWGVSVYEPSTCRLYHQIQSTDIIPGTQVIRDAGQKRKHHTVHPEPIDGQFDLVKGLFIPSPNQELSHYSFKYGYVTHTNQRGLYKLDLVNLRYTRSVDLTPYNCVPEEVQFSALYGLVIMECLEPVTNRPAGQLLLDYLTDTVMATRPTLPGIPFISPDSRKLVTLDRTKSGATLIIQEITRKLFLHYIKLKCFLIKKERENFYKYGKCLKWNYAVYTCILFSANGLLFSFDVKTTLNISDVTFYPSQTTHSYDIYASAQDKEDILFLNLLTGKYIFTQRWDETFYKPTFTCFSQLVLIVFSGKVEMITGVGKPVSTKLTKWGNPNRPISGSGEANKTLKQRERCFSSLLIPL
ncbi:follistatin-related [Holotrichia oblita]|uniref:Follistatin-related n=1 Tax=Holotrichia oblita TaxID=644536 RepID=A0ACB9TTX7_HOLOL|nr:follistatin-related [Holotrichia oblita]